MRPSRDTEFRTNRGLEAARHAATERWSNGPVEGQINRLKTLKRSIYRCAGVQLLRAPLMPFS
jgi:transposase